MKEAVQRKETRERKAKRLSKREKLESERSENESHHKCISELKERKRGKEERRKG